MRLSIDGRNPSGKEALYKSATTAASLKAHFFQITFGIALGPDAFFNFNGSNCHVCFPRCGKGAVRDLAHRDAVGVIQGLSDSCAQVDFKGRK